METMEKSMESHGNGKIHWKKSMEMSIPISESLCIHIYPIITGDTNSISRFVKVELQAGCDCLEAYIPYPGNETW